ncbi:MAG: type II toxin-antitoxin system VapC family toxin [Acidobacteria bacterium]|nr:type II toxin-antitoxin system VapC family toxin [Acidobacteriota bacterium]
MTGPLLLDTDVIVDYLRGHERAVQWIDGLETPVYLSMVTIAELYAGVRDGEERPGLDQFLHAFTPVEVTPAIAKQAGLYRRDYGKSHGTGLGDAIIAASAVAVNATLATLNRKHFPMLDQVLTPYRKP